MFLICRGLVSVIWPRSALVGQRWKYQQGSELKQSDLHRDIVRIGGVLMLVVGLGIGAMVLEHGATERLRARMLATWGVNHVPDDQGGWVQVYDDLPMVHPVGDPDPPLPVSDEPTGFSRQPRTFRYGVVGVEQHHPVIVPAGARPGDLVVGVDLGLCDPVEVRLWQDAETVHISVVGTMSPLMVTAAEALPYLAEGEPCAATDVGSVELLLIPVDGGLAGRQVVDTRTGERALAVGEHR